MRPLMQSAAKGCFEPNVTDAAKSANDRYWPRWLQKRMSLSLD